LFLGPGSGEHTIKITRDSMKYAGINGEWESNWTIKAYDNSHQHFQIVFDSGNGDSYPQGQTFSGTYLLNDPMLTIQLAKGLDSYPELPSSSSCTDDDSNPLPDCKLYMKQPNQ
jgi:hypothetical protein